MALRAIWTCGGLTGARSAGRNAGSTFGPCLRQQALQHPAGMAAGFASRARVCRPQARQLPLPPARLASRHASRIAYGTRPEVIERLRRRRRIAAVGFAACMVVNIVAGAYAWSVFAAQQAEKAAEKKAESQAQGGDDGAAFPEIRRQPDRLVQRLDAPVTVVQDKPGVPSVKVDQDGHELVETGTSSVPHFPKTIVVPGDSLDPAAQPLSQVPGQQTLDGEEYQLLGLGIRTVSFLRVQVYVLGFYVRTSDLDKLQAAFVRHINPLGSSLIPSEKEVLKQKLVAQSEDSFELWDTVLRTTDIRSAVRIVPTRGTDFAHLRDGWVRAIAAKTQDAANKAAAVARQAGTPPIPTEYDDEAFGDAVAQFKKLLGTAGKAPKGSVVTLVRDARGRLDVHFQNDRSSDKGLVVDRHVAAPSLGQVADARLGRLLWLAYLAGPRVSSEAARQSVCAGVLELVERPVGTLGTQVS